LAARLALAMEDPRSDAIGLPRLNCSCLSGFGARVGSQPFRRIPSCQLLRGRRFLYIPRHFNGSALPPIQVKDTKNHDNRPRRSPRQRILARSDPERRRLHYRLLQQFHLQGHRERRRHHKTTTRQQQNNKRRVSKND
jgi:hypothetical protein